MIINVYKCGYRIFRAASQHTVFQGNKPWLFSDSSHFRIATIRCAIQTCWIPPVERVLSMMYCALQEAQTLSTPFKNLSLLYKHIQTTSVCGQGLFWCQDLKHWEAMEQCQVIRVQSGGKAGSTVSTMELQLLLPCQRTLILCCRYVCISMWCWKTPVLSTMHSDKVWQA